MHLPCPQCQTVYDIDPNVYRPGAVFECVNCKGRVVVPDQQTEETASPPPIEEPEAPDSLPDLDLEMDLGDSPLEMDLSATPPDDASPLDESLAHSSPPYEDSEPQDSSDLLDPAAELPELGLDLDATTIKPALGRGADMQDDALHTDLSADATTVSRPSDAAPAGSSPEANNDMDATMVKQAAVSADDDLGEIDDFMDQIPELDISGQSPESDTVIDPEDDVPIDDLPLHDLDLDMDAPADAGAPEALPSVGHTPPPLFDDDSQAAIPQLASIDDFLDPSFLDDIAPEVPPAAGEVGNASAGFDLNRVTDTIDLAGTAVDLTQDLHRPPPEAFDDADPSEAESSGQFVPNLMDDSHEMDAPSWDGEGAAPGASADASSYQAPEPQLGEQTEPTSKSGRSLAIAAVFLIASIAGAAYFVDLTALLGIGAPREVDVTALPDTPKPGSSQPKTAEPEPPKEPAVELSMGNVNQLTYGELSSVLGVPASDDESNPALRHWAGFRQAYVFKSTEAASSVAKLAPSEELAEAGSSLEAAVAVGALRIAGKAAQARKQGELFWKTKRNRSAELAFALATVYHALGKSQKTNLFFQRALKRQPNMIDAKIMLGQAQLQTKSAGAGRKLLQSVIDAESPNENRLRVIGALLDGQQFRDASLMADAFDLTSPTDSYAPALRTIHEHVLSYRAVLSGKLDHTITRARKELEADPDNLDKSIQLGRLLNAADKGGLTQLKERSKAAKSAEEKGRLAYEMVNLQITSGDFKAAEETIKSIENLTEAEGGGWPQLARGELAEAQAKPDVARAAFKAALKLNPGVARAALALENINAGKAGPNLASLTRLHRKTKSLHVQVALAKAMSSKGNAAGAARLLEPALWNNPTVDVPTSLALSYITAISKGGDIQRTRALGETLAKNRPGDARIPSLLLKNARKMRELGEEERWLRKLNELEPYKLKHVVPLAEVLLKQDKARTAREVIEVFLKEKPDWRTAELLRLLARTWVVDDDIKARSYLKDSIDKKPEASTYVLLGDLEARRSNPDNANKAYLEALRLAPQLVDVRRRLADLLLKSGQWNDGIKQLELIVRYQPTDRASRELLGDTYRDQGRAREALNAYRSSLHRTNPSPAVLMKAARLQQHQLGQTREAMKTLQQILQINPDESEAHYRLGLAFKDLEKPQQATAEFKMYLRLAPNGEFAEEVKSELLSFNPQ